MQRMVADVQYFRHMLDDWRSKSIRMYGWRLSMENHE